MYDECLPYQQMPHIIKLITFLKITPLITTLFFWLKLLCLVKIENENIVVNQKKECEGSPMKPIIPKQIIIIFTSFFMFCAVLYTTLEIKGNAEVNKRNNDQLMEELDEAYEVNGPLKLTVVLERIYVDGEVSEEVLEETIWAMEDFWADYEDWQLVTQDEEQVVFQMHIDDISPLLKSNGYFGITEEGILTIFDGKPDEQSKIIQSFYQIDVEKLESHQHNLLKNGIKVFSKDEYEQVLEAFKPYSAQPH